MVKTYTLPAGLRVRRASFFQQAYAQKQKYLGRYAVLWLRTAENSTGALGVVASRKVGNSVARSRAKRRLREWYRLHRHALESQADYILVARNALLKASQAELDADLAGIFSEAGQLQSAP